MFFFVDSDGAHCGLGGRPVALEQYNGVLNKNVSRHHHPAVVSSTNSQIKTAQMWSF